MVCHPMLMPVFMQAVFFFLFFVTQFAGERFANLYAKHIVQAREKEKFKTTQQLVAIIYNVTPDAVKMRARSVLGIYAIV